MNLELLKKFTQHYEDIIITEKGTGNLHTKIDSLLEEVKLYLERCLLNDPSNTEIILRLAIVLNKLDMPDLAVESLDTIPETHFLYFKSLLLRAWILEEYTPLDMIAYNNLIKASQHETNPETKSMLLYCASWLWDLSLEQKRDLLAQSVTLCDQHVFNIQDLGTLMQDYGQKVLGTSLILDAMRNVVEVSLRYRSGDVTDPDEFINTHIKGIHINHVLFSFLIDGIDPNGFQWMKELQNKLHSENEGAH